LYRSVQRLYALPADTRVFVCHDYSPGGREPLCQTTIGAQRQSNIHLNADTTESEYVALRLARDATLDVPNLIIPSVQVNIRGGHRPAAEADGVALVVSETQVGAEPRVADDGFHGAVAISGKQPCIYHNPGRILDEKTILFIFSFVFGQCFRRTPESDQHLYGWDHDPGKRRNRQRGRYF
jgi:hypothetical protein